MPLSFLSNSLRLDQLPIEVEAHVNKRRKEMGVEPLNEYLQRNGSKKR